MMWARIVRFGAAILLSACAFVPGAVTGGAIRQDPAEGPTPASGDPGNQLYFSRLVSGPNTSNRGSLWTWSPASPGLSRVLPEHSVYGFCFSPDGSRLAFLGVRPPDRWPMLDLYVYEVATGELRRVTTDLWAHDYSAPAWRPGTSEVAIARLTNRNWRDWAERGVPGDGGLWLVDTETGDLTQLVGGSDSELPMNLEPRFSQDGSMLVSARQGRYDAVLELDRPRDWLRLDPRLMSGCFLMDWAWKAGTGNLLVATSRGTCRVRVEGRMVDVEGPGGVWEWHTTYSTAVRVPGLSQLAHDAGPISLELVCAEGETVYALAPSNRGRDLAYVTETGVWFWDFDKQERARLLGPQDVPEAREWAKLHAHAPAGETYARVAWSPDDSHVCLRTWEPLGGWRLRVVGVPSGELTTVSEEGRQLVFEIFAAWRPRT
jgi:hypothetical protein